MIRKLLIIPCLLFSSVIFSQVSAGQVDDFEDGTTQNWFEGSGTGPINVSTGGPDGVDDNYLMDTATGTAGPGGRLVIRNLGNQWFGDYTSESIVTITFDARAEINDLDLRLSITGSGGKFSTNNFVTVTAGSGWTEVSLSILPSDFVSVSDGSGGGPPGTDIALTLASVSELRILSSPTPAWAGEIIEAEMHLDNITASTTLSTSEFNKLSDFNIYPNPSKSVLNISLPNKFSETKLEVFNILGAKVYSKNLSQLKTAINVSQWRSGVYLVRISTDNETITKRFIKQ